MTNPPRKQPATSRSPGPASAPADLGPTVAAADAATWRAWLAEHADTATEVWLVLGHRDAPTPSVGYAEAVEQALCFGWIDGHHRSGDDTSSRLRFSPRRARSGWSAPNRERAARMIAEGQMTERGQAEIDRAKADGRWQLLADDEVDTVPADLQDLFDADPVAAGHFAAFPPSSRREILAWIAGAKRPETRARRVAHTAALAAQDVRANHPGAPGLGRP